VTTSKAIPGDICPAIVVRTFGGPAVNLQVFLDGGDSAVNYPE
jgi:hypothetical protein